MGEDREMAHAAAGSGMRGHQSRELWFARTSRTMMVGYAVIG